ncbi:hypothetical protein B0A49_09006, partial [Cryomyces minteri]
ACPVGAEAGVTTALREVKLDNKLKLLDSPGIVFPSSTEASKAHRTDEQARLILLNAVSPKEIEDPVPAVSLLLKRLSASQDMFQKLLDVYSLPALMSSNGDPTTDFLVQTVITDWRDGRIQGWMDAPVLLIAPDTAPGAENEGDAPAGDRKEIVKEWAAEFKLEGLWGDASADVQEGEVQAMES